mmetsp:Transcript_61952/g.183025  ORF Transcript_61952/g.183025 Transcript_61952/m.183025 type:complete len:96 (+) Transcript_61952:1832-2119(+)
MEFSVTRDDYERHQIEAENLTDTVEDIAQKLVAVGSATGGLPPRRDMPPPNLKALIDRSVLSSVGSQMRVQGDDLKEDLQEEIHLAGTQVISSSL